jgi:hypothetical protein
MKETHCYVDPYPRAEPDPTDDEVDTYVLPDGTEVNLPKKIFHQSTARLLDNPALDTPLTVGGIVKQTFESLSLCDETLRGELMGNILLAGGTSLLPGLGDRLQVTHAGPLTFLTDAFLVPRCLHQSLCLWCMFVHSTFHCILFRPSPSSLCLPPPL